MTGQEEIERRFAEAMGDLLRDGYWSNTAYAPGQEELLYLEAAEVMAALSKPSVLRKRESCSASAEPPLSPLA